MKFLLTLITEAQQSASRLRNTHCYSCLYKNYVCTCVQKLRELQTLLMEIQENRIKIGPAVRDMDYKTAGSLKKSIYSKDKCECVLFI